MGSNSAFDPPQRKQAGMEACLIDCITTSLQVYMYRNATFLCERLYAEYPSESNLHLLATCYFRSNQAHRVYHILKGSKSVQSRYLFALACFEMGSLAEAETALLPSDEPGVEVPNGAAGYYMLGLICRYTNRRQAAITHYTQALSLNPFFWSAYEDLCLLGAEEEAEALYGDLATLNLHRQQLQWEMQSQQSRLINNDVGMNAVSIGGAGMYTPIHGGTSFMTPSPGPSQVPAGPTALNRPTHGVIASSTGTSGVSGQTGEVSPRGVNAPGQPQRRKLMDEGKLKKVSGRLFTETAPRRSTRLSADSNAGSGQQNSLIGSSTMVTASFPSGNGPGHAANTSQGPTSRGASASVRTNAMRKSLVGMPEAMVDEGQGRKIGDVFEETCGDESGRRGMTAVSPEEERGKSVSQSSPVPFNSKRSLEGALELLGMLRLLGEAFRHLSMYRCQEALQVFMKLNQQQYATGWVLCQVGKAYFEMVNYPEAERAFSWARRVMPHRLEGMDVYSTVLYHMKKEVELSYLAQETVAIDRMAPQSWIVMGNCFSLQKDHEAALKYFQRALQLDPYFTYAHTLCGHEYVAMEDFKEGLSSYRHAIRIDSRHYNAWYGLGTIYFRQEKFEFAEYHFRRALAVNHRSSVLLCYLGMALHALKKNRDGLAVLEQAIVADPKNPLPKFQKASVLMSEERYEDALKELEYLNEVAPRESSVFFLMGKIYKKLNLPEQAMYHFCIALDLKPSTSDVNLIKSAIEKLHVPDDLEEDNL